MAQTAKKDSDLDKIAETTLQVERSLDLDSATPETNQKEPNFSLSTIFDLEITLK